MAASPLMVKDMIFTADFIKTASLGKSVPTK